MFGGLHGCVNRLCVVAVGGLHGYVNRLHVVVDDVVRTMRLSMLALRLNLHRDKELLKSFDTNIIKHHLSLPPTPR